MLNIQAFLTNTRTAQTYEVSIVPPELEALQIKGTFDISFPFGFNKGISSAKVSFFRTEKDLLLSNYNNYGAAANWKLSIFYANLSTPIVVILDFTDITYNSVSLEIGFKITPLLDRCRNFDKKNEFINFTPQPFTLKSKITQNIVCNFDHWGITPSTISIADIRGTGLIDADGIEYNSDIVDMDKAFAVFAIRRKAATETAQYYDLSVALNSLQIRIWHVTGTLTLTLNTDYLFYYSDGTHGFVNIKTANCTSSQAQLVVSQLANIKTNLPKIVDFANLPYNEAKTLSEAYVVVSLDVSGPDEMLENPVHVWCSNIVISHNYVQIDELIKGVRVSDYMAKINELAGDDIFEPSLLFTLSDIVITSTNFMRGRNSFLQGSVIDLVEALSAYCGFSFIEENDKYNLGTINTISSLAANNLSQFSDENYEPILQIVDFEIGEDTDIELKILPRLFEKRRYFIDIDTNANLEPFIFPSKIKVSGELILNKLINKSYDDNLLFLKIVDVNYGSFGTVLNEYFSNDNIIDRHARLLKSFLVRDYQLNYRTSTNQLIIHDFPASSSKLFNRSYRNITAPATNELISILTGEFKPFLLDGKKYLAVEYAVNLEPNTVSIKLLEVL